MTLTVGVMHYFKLERTAVRPSSAEPLAKPCQVTPRSVTGRLLTACTIALSRVVNAAAASAPLPAHMRCTVLMAPFIFVHEVQRPRRADLCVCTTQCADLIEPSVCMHQA